MPDLSRYDKYLNYPGPTEIERHAGYKNVQIKFIPLAKPIISGGSMLKIPPRLAKHHRITVQGLRINK